MRRQLTSRLLLPSLLVLGLAACGGGDTAESLANDSIDAMSDLTATLAKVTDKASAEKHKGDVEAAVERMNALKAKAEALPKDQQEPTKEQMAKLEPKMTALMQSMMTEMARLASNPEAQAVLMPVIEKMQE